MLEKINIKKTILVVLSTFMFSLVLSGCTSTTDTTADIEENKESQNREESMISESNQIEEESSIEEPALTREQENAIGKADSYLRFSAFSKSGLVDQLVFEGFPNEVAEFAVDNIVVDWNAQALKKAESYLAFSNFSDQGLIDQLIFEGFTTEQAQFAIDNLE